MADPLQPVEPGRVSPFLLSPATVNATLDAARAFRDRRRGKLGGDPFDELGDAANYCRVKWDGDIGLFLSAFSVLAYGASTVDPEDASLRQDSSKAPVFKGSAPILASSPFVITTEPIQGQSIGRAVVSGLAVVQVDVQNAAHRRAQPSPGITANLVSGGAGVPIVWPQEFTQTGLQWCEVLLGDSADSLPQFYWDESSFGDTGTYGVNTFLAGNTFCSSQTPMLFASGFVQTGGSGATIWIGWNFDTPPSGTVAITQALKLILPANGAFAFSLTGSVDFGGGPPACTQINVLYKVTAGSVSAIVLAGILAVPGVSSVCSTGSGSGSGSSGSGSGGSSSGSGGGGGVAAACGTASMIGTTATLTITGGPMAGVYTATWAAYVLDGLRVSFLLPDTTYLVLFCRDTPNHIREFIRETLLDSGGPTDTASITPGPPYQATAVLPSNASVYGDGVTGATSVVVT